MPNLNEDFKIYMWLILAYGAGMLTLFILLFS